jgi:alpha-1,4-galacturonosyltransferase
MSEIIDIAMCMNRVQFIGALAAINSIVRNTEHPQDIFFHFVVGVAESPEFRESIRESFPDPGFRYEIKEFGPNPLLEDYIHAGQGFTYATPESQVMNFSRFYLPQIYPSLSKVIYLDADLIVRADIADLFHLGNLGGHVLAAVPDGTFDSWEEYTKKDSRHLRHIEYDQPTFNAGVFVTDLSKWQEQEVLEKLEAWIKIHRLALADFYFGTQSIMNLAFYRDFQQLPPGWNVQPMGWYDNIPEETLQSGKILHWAGKRKPWLAEGLYKEYWIDYDVGRSQDERFSDHTQPGGRAQLHRAARPRPDPDV